MSAAVHVGSVTSAPGLWNTGLAVVAHELSPSEACGIFPDQGLSLCIRHWPADSFSLRHEGSPRLRCLRWPLFLTSDVEHFVNVGPQRVGQKLYKLKERPSIKEWRGVDEEFTCKEVDGGH